MPRLIIFILFSLLAACGKSGELYLPEDQPASAASATTNKEG